MSEVGKSIHPFYISFYIQGVRDLLVSYRSGDMWAPRVDHTEALQLEARYFLDCVTSSEQPFNDGRAGLRVVKMLEWADDSLRRRKEVVYAAGRRRKSGRTRAPQPAAA